MRGELIRRATLMMAVLFVIGLCFVDASAQGRRRRQSRRVPNPVKTQPAPQPQPSPATTDPTIISTADDQSGAADNNQTSNTRARNRSRTTNAPESEQESLRRTVDNLSAQVTKLSDKISKMDEQQRTLVNMERLSRAEQQAENLRAQLRDVQAKEAELQAKADQLDIELRPENLDRSIATYGTTRPEEVREQRRRYLESERARVRTQLETLATSRVRLESAIANADAEVDRLRASLDAANSTEQTTTDDTMTDGTTTTQTPTTTTTPPPR